MAISDRIRKIVLERDGSRCYHCGTSENLQIHHRRSKGFGGSKLLDLYQNLITVCAAYNYAMEADADTAAEAREYGHKLQSWRDISDPVFDTPNLTWYKLTEDGDRVKTEAPSYLI
jgi:hypothetical protein